MAKEIHDDVAFAILSKLPLKSLNRFTCVHKSWDHLLENSYFMNMFRNNFLSKHHYYYNDTSLLLQTNYTTHNSHSALYFLLGDKFENRVKLDGPPPIQKDGPEYIEICGSAIHGTFCLFSIIRSGKRFALWNPVTKEFRIIPPSPLESIHYPMITLRGFGYDPIKDDFKVIRKLSYLSWTNRSGEDNWLCRGPCWEMYSLRSNSWKKLDMHADYTYSNHEIGCDINGACHWLAKARKYDNEKRLISFNLSSEVFFTTPLLLDMGNRMVVKSLVAINRSIAVISKYPDITFHISILGELVVKESWTKLFIVGHLYGITHPIGVGKKGIFFKKIDGKLALFDFSTQMLEETIFAEQLDSGRIINYKESILPFGRTNY